MATTIEVNKQSVKDLLKSGKDKKFIIPDYQRPYQWNDEHIQTLFDDLTEYTKNKTESTYFLGSIVAYESKKQEIQEIKEQEIIDGQQRITTLFLFLRALYNKLCSMEATDEVKNFKSQIESAMWEQDELTAKVDFQKILIESRVMGEEGNAVFADILISGVTDERANDNYSSNYRLFEKLISEYAKNEPQLFFWLINNVLNKAILLPITADSQDTALTIFSTLNDRGLALSDADIFKAKIYSRLDARGKAEFIEQWRQLEEDSADAKESIQKLFYYYMFYLRAIENDRDTTTPGLRKYYFRNNFEKLYAPDIIANLDISLNLWRTVNIRSEIENEKWSINTEIKQMLDALSSYPNEFWKYPTVIYYFKYRLLDNFEELFLKFLKKLLAVLTARYILTPTVNAVKRGILNLNAEIIKSSSPKFDFDTIDEQELKEKIKHPHSGTVRLILKIIAYQNKNQTELLPQNWEIEHILPHKWQPTYFSSSTDSEVKTLVEHIGNKIPFEKKLNIIASNGYFKKKQDSYKDSKVKILLELSKNNSDWGLEQIRERDIRISDSLLKLFLDWGLNQSESQERETETPVPTEEELRTIEDLRRRGLIS